MLPEMSSLIDQARQLIGVEKKRVIIYLRKIFCHNCIIYVRSGMKKSNKKFVPCARVLLGHNDLLAVQYVLQLGLFCLSGACFG